MNNYKRAINELLEILIHRYGEDPDVLREILEDIINPNEFHELKVPMDIRFKDTEELFLKAQESNEDYHEIRDELRSLNTMGEITDDEYNYLISNWDELMRHYGI